MQQLELDTTQKIIPLRLNNEAAEQAELKYLRGKVRPFVKWAGGKTQLLNELSRSVPKRYNTYYEPFVGSGALFFHLLPDRAAINDSNKELVNAYLVIKDKVEDLINHLRTHINCQKYYYRIRALDPNKLSDVERASRFIFLNRTCYNGLYRVNKRDQFNVPYGKYKNPKMCNQKNLRLVSKVLRAVDLQIKAKDYKEAICGTGKADFIYLDPPYYPISKHSDFKRYTKDFFYKEDHIKLAKEFSSLTKRGCYVMLSNSYCDFTLNLYKDFNCHVVRARRNINKNGNDRGEIKELIVTNY